MSSNGVRTTLLIAAVEDYSDSANYNNEGAGIGFRAYFSDWTVATQARESKSQLLDLMSG
jgi:hypothetical protein